MMKSGCALTTWQDCGSNRVAIYDMRKRKNEDF